MNDTANDMARSGASAFELAAIAAQARSNLARLREFFGSSADPAEQLADTAAFNRIDDFLRGAINEHAPGAF